MAHHHHGHDHVHGRHPPHAPGHAHAPASFGRVFLIGVALNLGIVVLQTVYGVLSNSMALLADAGHNLSDVLGLAVAWIGTALARRPPSERFSYGLKGSSILAALLNALLLLVAVGGLSWEALRRLAEPQPVAGGAVMAVAAIGLVLNGLTAWMLAAAGRHDINLRGAFLHMAADAAVSAGVVVAGLAMWLTGWLWLDPAVSLAINAVILWGTWRLLTESAAMALNATPSGIDPSAVRAFLAGQPGVAGVHDLHIWPMSATEIALTAHLVMPDGCAADEFLLEAGEELRRRFGVGHVTLQVERDGRRCPLAPEHVV